jgi:type II secretory pathway component GspD/PulD (secretin)
MNTGIRFRFARAALVGGAALLLLAVPGPAQQPEKATHVLRLKHASATQALRVVQKVMGDLVGLKGKITVAADERTNTLVMQGLPPDVLAVAKLVEQIDVPGREGPPRAAPEIQVFPLGGLDPDRGVEEALRLVLPPPARFTIDRARRTVLVHGSPEAVAGARAVLSRLEEVASDAASRRPVRVRVFWLVSAAADEKSPALPEPIRQAAGELESLGVVRPQAAAELAAFVTPGSPFEINGQARLGAPYRLALTGSLTESRGSVQLDVHFTASGPSGRRGGEVGGLHTRLAVPVGRPVVLGALPVDGRPSALVAVVGAAPPAAKPKPRPKKFTFEMRKQPWGKVLEWLSDQSGLPLIALHRPTGTFNFTPPKGQKYTLAEIQDILNEALLAKKYLLVRRDKSLQLFPADERIDPSLVPRVEPADLAGLPKTQLAQVLIPVRGAVAMDLAHEVRGLLGPFGQVTVLGQSNQLLLLDTAANLRAVYAVLQAVGKKSKAGAP